MHYRTVERWAQSQSWLHHRDPRVKIAVLLAFLVSLSTTPARHGAALTGHAVLALAALLSSGIPFLPAIARACLVLPFALLPAGLILVSGDGARAATLPLKSLLSALAALILVATTPVPVLMSALRWFRVPALLLDVAQFVYRYLFVIGDQANRMVLAAQCRGGPGRKRRFQAAAGTLGVLFGRSLQRADAIHHAMLARGYAGLLPVASAHKSDPADAALLLFAMACVLTLRALP